MRAIRSIVGNVVSSNNVLVYHQVGNTNAYKNGKAIQVDAAPYRDSQGNGMASISSLCDNLGLELSWDENAKSGTITLQKTVLTIKLSDTNLQVGDATRNLRLRTGGRTAWFMRRSRISVRRFRGRPVRLPPKTAI